MASRCGKDTPTRSSPFCIDCQSHLYIPEFLSFLEKRRSPPWAYRRNGERYVQVGEWPLQLRPDHTSVEAKLAMMDNEGIDLTLLSTNFPGPELFGSEGSALARMMNDYIADVSCRYPHRFAGLAVLPTQDIDESEKELHRAVCELQMKGLMLFSNQNGRFADEPEFRPLFRCAEQLGVPIVLHPTHPVSFEATRGYEMTGGLGWMFDSTIALARIIAAGILEQHPNLKLVCPHLGGTLPYLIGRMDYQAAVLGWGAENITKAPSEHLRSVYLDTASVMARTIRYAYDVVGPDRLLFASDHPWVNPALTRGAIRQLNLPAADEEKIFGENARRLFGIGAGE
jgi:predicted TIM-barrel fold metal-dependent hydrolase